MFVLFQPVWLLLLIPLAAAWFTWPLPNRGVENLARHDFLLVVLALAQLAVKLPDRAGTVIVVADRSESMPQNSDASEKEIIGLLHKSMGPRDQLGVVCVRTRCRRRTIAAARRVWRLHGAGRRGSFEFERRD
jgi:hypothetical protein